MHQPATLTNSTTPRAALRTVCSAMVQVPFNLTDPNLKIQTPHAPDFFACISHSGACTLTASSSMPPCAVSSTAHPPSIPPATSKSPLAALSQPQPAHSLLLSPLRPPAEPSTIATALSTIATALSTTEPTAVATAVAAAVAAAAVASKPASISSTTVATAVSATAIAAFAFAFAALAALAITPLLPSSAGTLGRKPLLRAGRQPLSSSAALSAAIAAPPPPPLPPPRPPPPSPPPLSLLPRRRSRRLARPR